MIWIIYFIFGLKLKPHEEFQKQNSRHCTSTTNTVPPRELSNYINYSNREIINDCSNMALHLACLRSGLPRTRLEISQCQGISPLHIPKDLQLVKFVFESLRIRDASTELPIGAHRSCDWVRCCSHEPSLQLRFEGVPGDFHSSTIFRASIGFISDVGLVHEAYWLKSVLDSLPFQDSRF